MKESVLFVVFLVCNESSPFFSDPQALNAFLEQEQNANKVRVSSYKPSTCN
jgi:hypothetical protein